MPPPDEGTPPKEKKEYARVSTVLGKQGLSREYTNYCLCYFCCEVFINDTILNALFCPKCPATLPMMNFTDFERAIQESYRAAEIRRKLQQGAQGSSGRAA